MSDWIAPLPRPAAPAQPLAIPNSLAVGSFAFVTRKQALEARWHYIVGKLAEWKRAHPGTGFPREWLNEKDSIDNDLRLMSLDEKNRVNDSMVAPHAVNEAPSKARTPLERFRECVAILKREGGTLPNVIEALDLCAQAMPEPAAPRPKKFDCAGDIVIDGDLSIEDGPLTLEDQK